MPHLFHDLFVRLPWLNFGRALVQVFGANIFLTAMPHSRITVDSLYEFIYYMYAYSDVRTTFNNVVSLRVFIHNENEGFIFFCPAIKNCGKSEVN